MGHHAGPFPLPFRGRRTLMHLLANEFYHFSILVGNPNRKKHKPNEKMDRAYFEIVMGAVPELSKIGYFV
jgi:hypothetical protein